MLDADEPLVFEVPLISSMNIVYPLTFCYTDFLIEPLSNDAFPVGVFLENAE